MKGITIKNVNKNFFSLRGKISALTNINLKIDPGGFFVLLGPSGCGKSTLLNIIAGIEKLSSGEVTIDNKVVISSEKQIYLTPRERNIAMVFQNYALYPHMTVFENIAFPLKIAGVGKEEIQGRVEKTAKILEIFGLLMSKPKELSGGQKQRTAIGRAIVRRPDVLLFDEPLSNLDARLRINMRDELKELQKKLKITTIYVTHDQTEAMVLGDTVAVMKDGVIQQTGKPFDIYNGPDNLFVAEFMGTPPINLLKGEFLKIAGIDEVDGRSTDNYIMGIRPEHISIVEKSDLCAEINFVSSLGAESLLYLTVNGHKMHTKIYGSVAFKAGDSVNIAFNRENIHIFEKESGLKVQL